MLKVHEKGYLFSDQDSAAERKACKDKRQFNTRKLAKEWRNKHPQSAKHVYNCSFCGLFHLTNNGHERYIDGQIDWREFNGPDSIRYKAEREKSKADARKASEAILKSATLSHTCPERPVCK